MVGHGVARLHLQRADGLPARRRPRPGPQAGQAAGRDDHRRVRARVRLEHARDPPRRDRARPAGADRRRPARDRRHGPRARSSWSSGSRARSSASPSSSSSTSSRAATGSTAAASRASSSTDRRTQRGRRLADPRADPNAATRRPARRTPRRPEPRRRAAGRRASTSAGGGSSGQFAGEVVQTAATVVGAAQALQQRLGRGGQRDPRPGRPAAGDARRGRRRPTGATPRPGRPASGRRSARTAACSVLIDQRRLPDALVEIECRSAGEVACAIREMIVRGAPAIGQVGGHRARADAPRTGATAAPYARRATIRGAANALLNARPTAVNLRWAVERVLARYDGGRRAVRGRRRDRRRACAPRPTRSSSRRPTDHGRLADVRPGRSCPSPTDRPVRILTHCNTGPLACGQFGTALGVVQAAHHAGRAVHVWVDETRPYLQGARLTAWELAQAGVPHTLHPRRGRRAPDGPRRGRRRPRRGGPGRGQRRHGQQGRDLPAGRPRRPPRHPVLRLRADQLGRPRDAGRRRPSRSRSARPTRSSSSAASGSRRPGPTVRNPAFDVTPAELITGDRHRGGRRPRSVRGRPARGAASAAARWAAMPGHGRAVAPSAERRRRAAAAG